jgi:phenylalanyl-tRNA synthetase beta chain
VKFSYNWIRELVPGLDLGPKELARLITMKTAECEEVLSTAPWLDAVRVARVLSVEPVEGSHNVKAVVDAGPEYGNVTVVCGAHNCRPGLLTAYVPPGITVAGAKHVRTAVIHGIESAGMLASGAELGLNRDHEGILELDGAAPGAPIPGCPPDFEIEVDNKSLTHRPDLWGHHGIAREVAAITACDLVEPADLSLIPKGEPAWNIDIHDFELCPRYSALVFENVTVGPSPLWLQYRLEAIGLNPISNVVDVTNYIMAEMAQPMHAFDAGWLKGNTIIVRRAADGEPFKALNDESYTLSNANLVIADSGGPVALAGVIGGAGSAINEKTTRIVLESANFQAASIRRTSATHKLRTDASIRFEKAQDPLNTVRALARAVALLREVCPGIRVVGGLVDSYRPAAAPAPIEMPLDWLARKLGRTVEPAEVRRILESLRFGVEEKKPGVFSVTVPSWRATKDVTIKEDLSEEVGRIVGYDTIPLTAPVMPVEKPWTNHERVFHHQVRELCAAQGYTETYNYSYISDEQARRFGFAPEDHIRVANPVSIENSLMRLSLLPGLHRNIVENMKRFDEFRLFEIGVEIHRRPPSAEDANPLPDEVPHLLAVLYSKSGPDSAYYEVKRLAECLLPGATARPAAPRAYEHPARSAEITWRGETLARIYEFHPSFVETGRATLLDVDLGAVLRLGPQPKKYTPLQRYPSSAFDLSAVAGLRALCGDVEAAIRAGAGKGAEKVEYLYSYRGKPLADDQQSLTFRVTVSAPDHTLSNDELTAIRARIIGSLKAVGFALRG